ncbi:TPA: hypothetical protein LQO10_002321 [Staphylococcus pseudintermedius]|nr:hypothetical protein [Staphylococcus pseudintermedius]
MKLKVKKRMNFSELLHWAKQNNIKNRIFSSSDFITVRFDENGNANCTNVGHFEDYNEPNSLPKYFRNIVDLPSEVVNPITPEVFTEQRKEHQYI